jgi:hypothetical protein
VFHLVLDQGAEFFGIAHDGDRCRTGGLRDAYAATRLSSLPQRYWRKSGR